jgi:hypothetical protein
MTIVMRRTAIADGVADGVPEAMVVGSLASTATMVLALIVNLAFPAVGPWALVVLLADPVFAPLVRRLRGDTPSRRRSAGA